MPHIKLEEGVPGIRSLVLFRPETGKPLYELVQLLLRGPSTLTEAERELIAAYVSHRNKCIFCCESHAAAARCLLGNKGSDLVDLVLNDPDNAALSPKMRSLLKIAGKVQLSGKDVLPAEVADAYVNGASEREVHDTVLIAATFSMFNRYVDGLATLTPVDHQTYEEMGKRMAGGYKLPSRAQPS